MAFTVEQKAEMFDVLVAQLTPAEFIRYKRVQIARKPQFPPDWPTEVSFEYQDVPVYEWRFRSDGCSRFLDACAQLLKAALK